MRCCQPHITPGNCISDYRKHEMQIDKDYVNMVYSWYLEDLWEMEVGYRVHPKSKVFMDKWLLEWQAGSDCGTLCTDSRDQPVVVTSVPEVITTLNPCSIYLPLQAYSHNCGHRYHRGQDFFHMS